MNKNLVICKKIKFILNEIFGEDNVITDHVLDQFILFKINKKEKYIQISIDKIAWQSKNEPETLRITLDILNNSHIHVSDRFNLKESEISKSIFLKRIQNLDNLFVISKII